MEETDPQTKIDHFGRLVTKGRIRNRGESDRFSISKPIDNTKGRLMIINRYKPEKTRKETVFYIQSHGYHAGRPLKEPIPNSWEIDTETQNAFEICFMVYNSRFLKNYLRGSVIPFLSLREYKKIIKPIFENPIQFEETILKKLKTLELLDQVIKAQQEKHNYYTQMKTLIAHELLKSFQTKSH